MAYKDKASYESSPPCMSKARPTNPSFYETLNLVPLFWNTALRVEFFWFHKNTQATCNKGWRRPIGCLEVQVIFRKRATNCRALLWIMTYEDKASYGSPPPCTTLFLKHSFKSRVFLYFMLPAMKYNSTHVACVSETRHEISVKRCLVEL